MRQTKDEDQFWWYNEETGDSGCDDGYRCYRDDYVFGYQAKSEKKIFAVNEIIKNLRDLGIVDWPLTREQYRQLWMHLLVINDDEKLRSVWQHFAADYGFDEGEQHIVINYLAEAIAVGGVNKDSLPDEVLSMSLTIGGEQDRCRWRVLDNEQEQ